MRKRYLFLVILVCFFAISAVSAEEISNETNEALSVGDSISIFNQVDKTDNIINVSNNEILSITEGTYSELVSEIGSGGKIILKKNLYTYDSGDTIYINKPSTIDGNGAIIDMAGANIKIFAVNDDYYVTFKNITFKNINCNNYGCAIGMYSGAVENCNFINNTGKSSVAIHISNAGIVKNCNFINNTAKSGDDRGGAVSISHGTIENCNFINNLAKGSCGALYISNAGIVKNCNFINNTAKGSGGAIYSEDSGTIENCNFNNNNAPNGGSAIFFTNSGTVENSNFTNNGVSGGEVIYFWNGGNVLNCNFINNNKLSILFKKLGNVKNSYFNNNKGGCIYFTENGNVTKCNFINNTITSRGSAIYTGTSGTVENSIFINNAASRGGAIYFTTSGTVKNCNFINNTAKSDDYGGGAVFMDSGTIENCNFINNTANGKYSGGGAVYSTSCSIANSNFISNNAHKGSAIYTTGEYRYNDIKNSYFLNNKASSYSLDIILCENAIEIIFKGNNNLFNAIWCEGHISFTNITYWGTTGIVNSNNTHPSKSTNESGQNITITVVVNDILVLNTTKITDDEGKIILNLIAGDNQITAYHYDDSYYTKAQTTKSFSIEGFNTTLNLTTSDHSIIAKVTDGAAGNVIFTVKNKTDIVKISNITLNAGIAKLDLSELKNGEYDINAVYLGNNNYCPSENDITYVRSIDVIAPNVVKYYKGPERFVVIVKENNKPVVNGKVNIILNGQTYTKTTDSNGETSIGINLNSGVYNVTTEYNGTKVYSTVTVKDTVIAKDVTKIFRNSTQYQGTFVDSQGNLIRNTDVQININGVFYTRTTDANGMAQMNINLPQGTYILTAINPSTGEQHTTKVTVLPNIVENYDLTKYYKNESQYSLRLLDDKGNPVGWGVSIQLNINGVLYTRTSDTHGYVKMNINLPPGTYIITAEYKGLRVSNTIKVLPVLEANDLVMRYHDGSQFKAKVLDGQGRPYAGQNVTYNINGVFYTRTAGDDGIAGLTINLPAGEYIITSMYNGLNVANKVTIIG